MHHREDFKITKQIKENTEMDFMVLRKFLYTKFIKLNVPEKPRRKYIIKKHYRQIVYNLNIFKKNKTNPQRTS